MNRIHSSALSIISGTIIGLLNPVTNVSAQIAFVDNFDQYASPIVVTNTGDTNGYDIVFGAASGPKDFKAIFGFDYSTVTFPTSIPPAPHSTGGTTKGLYLTVNKDATAAAAAVNLYCRQYVSFNSPDFSLKFDVWLNWTNLANSTEHALFGVNHSGNVTNRISQTASDGVFFAMDGDGGMDPNLSDKVRDYSVYQGAGNGAAPILLFTNNTVFGPAPLLGGQFDNLNSGFTNLFPPKIIPGYPSTPAGSAGLGWVSGEVRQLGNTITWFLNDTVVAQFTNNSIYTNGDDFMLGYNDTIATIGDTNNFVIFDNVHFQPNPNIESITYYTVSEAGGFRMYFNAVVSGTPPFDYTWGFSDEDFTYPSFATTNSFLFTNQISRFFGPFDALPQSFYLTMERFKNGNRVGFDGAYGSPPSCGPVCLSVGTLSTRTGTDGSGTNVPLSSSCGPFPPGCRWFRMTTLPNAGMAMVSTEGSTYDTVLGVFSGSISSPGSLVPVACNNDISSSNKQSLVQFETQPNTSYWLVVNTNNIGTLKLTYGYNLNFGSVALNPVSHALDIRSAPVPSYQYQLLASTNLASLNWTIVATTNFTGNTITTNNIFRFSDTNGPNNRQRFYRIRLVQ